MAPENSFTQEHRQKESFIDVKQHRVVEPRLKRYQMQAFFTRSSADAHLSPTAFVAGIIRINFINLHTLVMVGRTADDDVC